MRHSTVREVWDDTNLKLTFRRCVDERLMHLWFELLNIADNISLTGEEDSVIWELHSSCLYNMQTLYTMVNFRGIIPIYIHAV